LKRLDIACDQHGQVKIAFGVCGVLYLAAKAVNSQQVADFVLISWLIASNFISPIVNPLGCGRLNLPFEAQASPRDYGLVLRKIDVDYSFKFQRFQPLARKGVSPGI